jgi:hypothetical protein
MRFYSQISCDIQPLFPESPALFSKHLNAMNDSISSSNAGINFPFSNFPFLSGGMPMLYDVIAKPKVMLPLFTRDRLYSLQLRIRYLSFFLKGFLSFLAARLCLLFFCLVTKNL